MNLDNYESGIVSAFHRLYYKHKQVTWGSTTWMGVPIQKCPLDLWIYQEIIYQLQPDLIIETGTWRGGSALYLASLLDMMGKGRVLTIDINPQEPLPIHPRLASLRGSSIDPVILDQVNQSTLGLKRVLVILDSDHSKAHVLEELRCYAAFVTVGSYLIVEDTNLNGNPVVPEFGPGPHEAVTEFLTHDDCFVIDAEREKFFITASPGGYLKKVR